MKKIKMIMFIGIIFCSFFLSNTIYAHTMLFSQGAESSGYIVGPTHASTSSLTYKVNTVKTYMGMAARTGATRWQNTGLVTVKESSSSNNVIMGYYNTNTKKIGIMSIRIMNLQILLSSLIYSSTITICLIIRRQGVIKLQRMNGDIPLD